MHERVLLAARNNALWCDGMCRAHGVPTEFTRRLWICRGTPPRFHSNGTTLRPGLATAADLVRLIEESPVPLGGFKDGFCDLDLAAHGYQELFEARWIWMDAPDHRATGLSWRRVSGDAELRDWEAGWAAGDADAAGLPPQFPPSLLASPDNAFMAGYRGLELRAGCILNRTPPVVGLSNVFSLDPDIAGMWTDFAAVSAAAFPGHPVVGYERGVDLAQALAAGFESIGPLRVWVLADG